MNSLSLSLLGSYQVTRGDQPASGFESNKVRALLAFLVVEADHPHTRDELTGLLWPEQSQRDARANLRQALANLRQAIGDEAAQPPYLLITRDSIQFNAQSNYRLDVSEFTALLNKRAQHIHRHAENCRSCAGWMQQASELYRGDFLEHFYIHGSQAFDEWALVKRENLHHLALEAFYTLAEYQERLKDWAKVYHYAAMQLQFDPWREEAHRQVMRALFFLGQRSAALNQYETCRRILWDEFGVKPGEDTHALYERMRDGKLDRDKTANNQEITSNPCSLIGREKELCELNEVLENPSHRLITLMGPGGIGKTCLARQVLEDQAGSFYHGGFFVPLYPLNTVNDLIPVIAEAINFPLVGRENPQKQLIQHLRKLEMLIVLDNFEQLISQQASEILVEILHHAPGVVFLVTSRVRLNLQVEWVYDLQGLSYPSPGELTAIIEYSSVRLFVQRAQQSRRQFSLTDESAKDVARICSLVEGTPLAIELAAAAIRTRSCAAIAADIESNLRSLETTMQDIPERHRSLKAVFEHSWHLLSQEEQLALRRISVFRDGFSEDAAVYLTELTPHQLWALVDKSLLRQDVHGRYDLHELISFYARHKLEQAGEGKTIQDRHAAYYLQFAEGAEAQLHTAQQPHSLARLEREHNNLRAALAWCIDQHDFETAARLGGALWLFWWMHGYISEGREWLGKALAAYPEYPAGLPPSIRARALKGAGGLAYQQGDLREAFPLLEECLKLQEHLGEPGEMADVLDSLGLVMAEQGDYAQAKSCFERALAIFRTMGEVGFGIEKLLNNYANLAFDQGDYKTSILMHEESLAISRKKGDLHSVSLSLTNLGWIALLMDDIERAEQTCREALSLANGLGNRPTIAFDLEGLAGVAGAQGNPIRSARLLGAAQALREAIQFPLAPSNHAYYDRIQSTTQAQLSQAAFLEAREAGRKLTLEEAIAEALAETGERSGTT